ncbi:MAG TPA: tetratricopeptide repeat protein [Candidatus Xenobia bacterium]
MNKRRVSALQAELHTARTLLDTQPDEAVRRLEALRQKSPNQVDVLRLLVVAYRNLDRPAQLRDALEALLVVEPAEAHRQLLGLISIQQGYPFRGLELLGLKPGQPSPPQLPPAPLLEARETLLKDFPPDMPVDEAWALRRGQEMVRMAVDRDDLREALRQARQVLERWPHDDWTLSTGAQLALQQDQCEDALALATRALEVDANSLHGLQVAVRALCMQGNVEAAKSYAERLQGLPNTSPGVVFEKLRALSFVADDAGVVTTLESFDLATITSDDDAAGILAWAGIAAAFLGQEDAARQFLNAARKRHPGWSLAADNLADLERPPAERHGPFALRLEDWLGSRFVKTQTALIGRTLQADSEHRREEAATALEKAHPPLIKLLPVLLFRSDPAARRLALEVARAGRLWALLLEFAQGQAGEDALRWSVVRWLQDAKVLEQPSVHMYMKGEWRDIRLMAFELRPDPHVEHRQGVALLIDTALEAYRKERYGEAEALIRQALVKESSSLELQLDLVTILIKQGRLDEAEAMVLVMPREHGRGLALLIEIRLAQGRLDEAAAMVVPNLSRPWLRTDFARFCDASMRLNVALGRPEENTSVQEARRWAIPDDSEVAWGL